MATSSLFTHGIPLDLLTVHASRGYVKMQSMNNAGKYQSHESLLKISGSEAIMNVQ
jgi:hypothetical protein